MKVHQRETEGLVEVDQDGLRFQRWWPDPWVESHHGRPAYMLDEALLQLVPPRADVPTQPRSLYASQQLFPSGCCFRNSFQRNLEVLPVAGPILWINRIHDCRHDLVFYK